MALRLKADPKLKPAEDDKPLPTDVLDLRESTLRKEYQAKHRFVVEVVRQPLEEADEQPVNEAEVEPLEKASGDRQSKEGSETAEKVKEKSADESAEIEKEFGGAATQEERELLQLHGIPRDAFHRENPTICPFHHENPCWEKANPTQTYVH